MSDEADCLPGIGRVINYDDVKGCALGSIFYCRKCTKLMDTLPEMAQHMSANNCVYLEHDPMLECARRGLLP